MSTTAAGGPDERTLVINRHMKAPRAAVWRCWTEPDLFKQWYCPRPWTVPEAEFDLRAGGRMTVVMQGPDGERVDVSGCFLEVAAPTSLVFTDSFDEGFIPKAQSFMTGYVVLATSDDGTTQMTWGARHATAEAAQKHLDMGFEQGWNTAADQLETLARSIVADADGVEPFKSKVRTCLFLRDQAEDTANFYTTLLADSTIDAVYRPAPEGPPLAVEFTLGGMPLMTMNGNPEPVASYLSSISVLTDNQPETDRLWSALLANGGEEGQCGWLKDQFGVHWQIVPTTLPRLLHGGDAEAASRVSAALMAMTKIDIAGLQAAFANQEQKP